MEKQEACPICGREMEDRRHVSVECFYDVKEIVPTATQAVVFQEVDKKTAIWGITRHYPKGKRDSIFIKKRSTNKLGTPVTEWGNKKVPVAPIRLLEKAIYSVPCCKACRGDFLRLFGEWAEGKHATPEGDGDIPVRINGAIKMLTPEEWEKYRASKEKDHVD